MRYERPKLTDLGSISDHTFMPNPGNSTNSHKGFANDFGDHDCELSHSGGTKPGLCGTRPRPGNH